MKKLAIFTEGQTEQLLSEWLVKNFVDTPQISIKVMKATGGRRGNPRIFNIHAESTQKNTEYFILIYNCEGDARVKSDITENYARLVSEGYEKIIALRDVYPDVKYEELSQLRAGLEKNLPAGNTPILFILGVMELEAWILAEYMHFPHIHEGITIERINNELNIDVLNDRLDQRTSPAQDLRNIYWLEMINYDKSKKIIETILSSMSFENLKYNVSRKFEDLSRLYQVLDLFFSADTEK